MARPSASRLRRNDERRSHLLAESIKLLPGPPHPRRPAMRPGPSIAAESMSASSAVLSVSPHICHRCRCCSRPRLAGRSREGERRFNVACQRVTIWKRIPTEITRQPFGPFATAVSAPSRRHLAHPESLALILADRLVFGVGFIFRLPFLIRERTG